MFYTKSCLSTFERTFPSVGGKTTNIPSPQAVESQCNSTKQSTTRSHLCMQELHILCRPSSLLSYHSCASLAVTMQAGLHLQLVLVTGSHQIQHFPCFQLVVLKLLHCVSQDSRLLHLNFGPSIWGAELQDQHNKMKSRTRQYHSLLGLQQAFCNL